MIKTLISLLVLAAAIAGCATPAGTADQPAPAVQATPGRAVIYVVRTRPDASYLTAPIMLDDQPLGATFAGTHMRLEVAPGRHRLTGYGADMGSLTVDVAADRVYFVQHSVAGSWRAPQPMSFFTLLDDTHGRAALARAGQRAGTGA